MILSCYRVFVIITPAFKKKIPSPIKVGLSTQKPHNFYFMGDNLLIHQFTSIFQSQRAMTHFLFNYDYKNSITTQYNLLILQIFLCRSKIRIILQTTQFFMKKAAMARLGKEKIPKHFKLGCQLKNHIICISWEIIY